MLGYSHNEILYNNEDEHNNVDESHKHNVEIKKPDFFKYSEYIMYTSCI